MDVTPEMVQDDSDALEIWYSDELARIKREVLDPVHKEVKQQNKAARAQYLAQRARLRKLMEAVANQPITVSDPAESEDTSPAA